MPDASSRQKQLIHTCPRCSGTDPSLTQAAHLGFTDSPAMPDASPLGGPVWEIALNHQGLDTSQVCNGGGKNGDVFGFLVSATCCDTTLVHEGLNCEALVETTEHEPKQSLALAMKYAVKWKISCRGNSNQLKNDQCGSRKPAYCNDQRREHTKMFRAAGNWTLYPH